MRRSWRRGEISLICDHLRVDLGGEERVVLCETCQGKSVKMFQHLVGKFLVRVM